MRWPGIEPGSTAWKAAMLAFTPPTLAEICVTNIEIDTHQTTDNDKILIKEVSRY